MQNEDLELALATHCLFTDCDKKTDPQSRIQPFKLANLEHAGWQKNEFVLVMS